jgi:uncharacterized phiE125 gp8 family phage protein
MNFSGYASRFGIPDAAGDNPSSGSTLMRLSHLLPQGEKGDSLYELTKQMPAVLRTAPAVEPISLAEAKAHLRIEDEAEDDVIAALISAARLNVESSHGLALITQGWTLSLDRWPRVPDISLPIWPVTAIETLKIIGEDDEALTIDDAHYIVELSARPARLMRRGGRHWPVPGKPAGGIEIDFAAGFGAAPQDVPEPIRHALKLYVGLLFEDRGLDPPAREPAAMAALLSPYRQWRL